MKKVIGIIGSLRKESIHRSIFEQYQEMAAGSFELEEGEIAEIPLFNPDLDTEPGSVTQLAKKLAAADGVIFFSPEYNYSIPGALKNAIDWLSTSDLNPLNSKSGAIIGASPGNIGTARMQYHLRQVGVFMDIRFMNKPEVMIGQSMSKMKDNRIVDERTIEHLRKHIDMFLKELESH